MITKAEIEEIASQISLNLDQPQSVRKQIQQLNITQQRLMVIKKELRQQMNQLNSQDNQQLTSDVFNIGIAFLPRGTKKWSAIARAGTRQLMTAQNRAERQPYQELIALIDDLLLQIANLKIEAQQYLLNQS
ncbi:hypothetical protein [Gloeocapsa sp. PCC 73106]|uniref:hypothetical protein n=1 Tax=Gloeocapsa sp. PCC 73106 TaxID=102232 RepID=UPI0002ABCDB6|nr:hypothetical protein [Gloeocapsa sp. PCC 73106]ELR97321.1 hypothetical protein GLO73106DRAFT_00011300 [Gloeocapsa sp. PCC 73106]